jgi:type II secretory ATPase GspE/PulE/Tfp pilus assembly ATPase PilB-like protein
MIDGVADQETAALAVAAGKRGMLVIAVVDSPDRLSQADMAITTTVVRKLCTKHLSDTAKLTRAELDELERLGADFAKVLAALKEEGKVDKNTAWKELQFTRPGGCSECTDGYQGVLGVQEVREKGEGPLNLIEDGLYKAAQGLTSIEEVLKLQ